MSNAHKNRIFTEETKLKISNANSGKIRTEENKNKISNSLKNIIFLITNIL